MADVRELKDQAADLFRKGKFAKAAEAYLALTKAEPKEGQHLIKLGDSHRRDGKKEPAIEAYRRAAEDYAKLGIVIKAIAACKLILEIDPGHKDAQEALANLCAKRYVRRDSVDELPPPPRARVPIDMELPDEVDDSLELDDRPPQKRAEPPKRTEPTRPPNPPPMIRSSNPPARAASIEIDALEDSIDLDAISVKPQKPVSRAAPAPAKAAEPETLELIDIDMGEPPAPAKAPEPIEIELELGAPEPFEKPPERRRGNAIDLATDEADFEEIQEVEELPADALVAESTEEHEVLRSARVEAARAPTPMANILSESLLIYGEGDGTDEIELMSITTGPAPALVPPPAPSDLDVAFAPADPAPARPASPAQRGRDEAALMALANEASFDPTPAPAADPEPEPAKPPPPPAVPAGDVVQSQVPLFSELPKDAFLDLLETVSFRRIEAGGVVLREGDPGKSIFVLASGKAKVVKGHGAQKPLELAQLDDGTFFGEMALLNGAPRLASVVAVTDCEVLELTEDVLRGLTTRHPLVAASLKKFYRQRLLSNVMAISPLFRAFDKADRKMLVEKFKLREAKANEVLIAEGSRPDGLYVVMHGAAVVTKKAPDGSRQIPLAVLKEGDVFGEMSLLSRQPATATVSAKRRTLVLRLPKAAFDELMFTHPSVLEVVSELTDQRTKVNEQILTGQLESPREALALL